jgi:hypothetical protein
MSIIAIGFINDSLGTSYLFVDESVPGSVFYFYYFVDCHNHLL